MNNEYASEVTRQAVGRACIALGLKSTSKSTLDSLADVVVNYIQTIAESAQDKAEQGGRTVVGIQDVLPVVEQTVLFTSQLTVLNFHFNVLLQAPISFWMERPKGFCV